MRRKVLAGIGLAGIPAAGLGLLVGRAADRLVAAPRYAPGEEGLRPALDALGGEVVHLRSRDGLQLAGRWLPAEPSDDGWKVDPHEAILLLHGWTGSVAPDLVELGPFMRRTAGVLGLDCRGHGASAPGPTTFGFLEVEDVAGALAWLGERGVTRVAIAGSSMGAGVALASVAVLGDGSLAAADSEIDAPRSPSPPPRPRIVAVVGDSASPDLLVPLTSQAASSVPRPLRRLGSGLVLRVVARRLGGDPRATEPVRILGLVAPVPVLLIHGESDETVPLAEARRLAGAFPDLVQLWTVPGAGHGASHRVDPAGYEARVTAFLRGALSGPRSAGPIIGAGTAVETSEA